MDLGVSATETVLDVDQRHIIRIVLITSASLSLIGAGSIVLTVIVKQKIGHVMVLPLFQLSLVDLLASIFLITTSILYDVQIGSPDITCAILSGFIFSLYTTAFLLTATYALNVYKRTKTALASPTRLSFSGTFQKTHGCLPWYIPLSYILSWAFPLLIIWPITATTLNKADTSATSCSDYNYRCLVIFHHRNDSCLNLPNRSDDHRLMSVKALFLFLLAFASVSVWLLYTLTYRIFRRSQLSRGLLGHRQYQEAGQVRNSGLQYSVMFSFCWAPAFALGLVTFSGETRIPDVFWLYVITAVTTPLQGFVNSLCYGWTRKSFVRAVEIDIMSSFLSDVLYVRHDSTPRTTSGRSPHDYRTFSEEENSEIVHVEKQFLWEPRVTNGHSSTGLYL